MRAQENITPEPRPQRNALHFLVDVAGMAAVMGQPSIEGSARARPLSWVVQRNATVLCGFIEGASSQLAGAGAFFASVR